MRSALLFVISFLLAPTVMAIPNIWTGGFGQGVAEHTILNENGDRFTLNCDSGYSEHGDLTNVSFTLSNGQDLSPTKERKVELLINGEVYWLPESLGWRNADGAWAKFLTAINKATMFDVYVDDKKIASFSPSEKSTKSELGDIGDCIYRY